MIFGSVCSGIEAASVAWDPLGWRPAWFAEIEKFPSAVLAHRWPGVMNHGDFTRIRNPAPCDVLVGGTPCQAFSIAGLRGGLSDSRGNLALEFMRLTQRLSPRWVVWENVPGVLSSNGGRDFGSILGALGQFGYGWAYRVLDAQFFGVPQRRRRVFLVAHLGDWRRAAAVLFERESLRGDLKTGRKARKKIADNVARSVALRGNKTHGGSHLELGEDLACTLKVGGGQPMAMMPATSITGQVAHTLCSDGYDSGEDGSGRGTPIVTVAPIPFDTTQITHRDNRSNPQPGDPCGTLPRQGHPPAIAYNAEGYEGSVAAALTCSNLSKTVNNQTPLVSDYRVRRLTPRECERLQGFPDDYTLIPRASDAARYKALGNSMAVPVMRWIGERIQAVDMIPEHD